METLLQRQDQYTTFQAKSIRGTYDLQTFLDTLEATEQKALLDLKSQLLATVNGMGEGMRDADKMIILHNEKHQPDVKKILESFSVISAGFIDRSHDSGLLSWLHFISTTFLKDQYIKEYTDAEKSGISELDVYEKFYNTTNFLSDQLLNELKRNVCTKGHLLYDYMNSKLATEEEMLKVLGFPSVSVAKNQLKFDVHKKQTSADMNKRTAIQMVFDMTDKMKRSTISEEVFAGAMNAYLGDQQLYTVYDIFVWYVEQGHPSLINLKDLHTEQATPEEFYETQKKHISPLEGKFHKAVDAKEYENALSKLEFARIYFREYILSLTEEEKSNLDVVLGLDLEYTGDEISNVQVFLDILDKEKLQSVLPELKISTKKKVFQLLLAEAKNRVETKAKNKSH